MTQGWEGTKRKERIRFVSRGEKKKKKKKKEMFECGSKIRGFLAPFIGVFDVAAITRDADDFWQMTERVSLRERRPFPSLPSISQTNRPIPNSSQKCQHSNFTYKNFTLLLNYTSLPYLILPYRAINFEKWLRKVKPIKMIKTDNHLKLSKYFSNWSISEGCNRLRRERSSFINNHHLAL